MGRGETKGRDEVALERLEALVRALEEEARALGTLHLLEEFKRELPAPVGSGPPLGTAPGEASLEEGDRPRRAPSPTEGRARPRRPR
ncbi:MAG: hypothetical protein RL653_2529 [Pseudomonadota bacterium]|jgi:hypothetical protein